MWGYTSESYDASIAMVFRSIDIAVCFIYQSWFQSILQLRKYVQLSGSCCRSIDIGIWDFKFNVGSCDEGDFKFKAR